MLKSMLALLGTLVLLSEPLPAQIQIFSARSLADSSAAMILSAYSRGPVNLLPILRQVDRPQSTAKLAELGKGLTQLILEEDLRSPRVSSLSYVIMAGRRADSSSSGEIPFVGALDVLFRVFESVEADRHLRNDALGGISTVVGHTRAMAYLTKVATSRDTLMAGYAMEVLIRSTDPKNPDKTAAERAETMRLLKNLWDKTATEKRVGHPGAGLGGGTPSIPVGAAWGNLYDLARWEGWVEGRVKPPYRPFSGGGG